MLDVAKGIFLATFILVFGIFILYKAVYDVLILSRRALIRRLEEAGHLEIQVSKAAFEDVENHFPEKPMTLLNAGSAPLFYVHFYKLKYRHANGAYHKAVARVEARYLTKADILLKEIE